MLPHTETSNGQNTAITALEEAKDNPLADDNLKMSIRTDTLILLQQFL